jgi:hypothetical protein
LYGIETGTAAAAIKAATDQAADLLLDHLEKAEGPESLIGASTLADSGATAGRIAELLSELNRDDATPARRKQLRVLRQKMDADCKTRFETSLNTDLLASLRALPDQPGIVDIMGLETTARSLRALESEARTFGGGDTYDRLLERASDTIQAHTKGGGMDMADRLRLVEILAGSEAALKMLERG